MVNNMNVKDELLREIEEMDEQELGWLLSVLRGSRMREVEKKLLAIAARGIIKVPDKILRREFEPVEGRGKSLSEIIIEDRR